MGCGAGRAGPGVKGVWERASLGERFSAREKGASGGYRIEAPSYVTRLVGYHRDAGTRFWLSRSDKIIVGSESLRFENTVGRSADRGEWFFRRGGGGAALGAALPVAPDGGGRAGRRAGGAESAGPPRAPAVRDPGGRYLGQPGLGWAGEDTLYGSCWRRFIPSPRPSREIPARRLPGGFLSGHQLFPRGDRRSGAQEPGHCQGRPPGGPGGAACWPFYRVFPSRSWWSSNVRRAPSPEPCGCARRPTAAAIRRRN